MNTEEKAMTDGEMSMSEEWCPTAAEWNEVLEVEVGDTLVAALDRVCRHTPVLSSLVEGAEEMLRRHAAAVVQPRPEGITPVSVRQVEAALQLLQTLAPDGDRSRLERALWDHVAWDRGVDFRMETLTSPLFCQLRGQLGLDRLDNIQHLVHRTLYFTPWCHFHTNLASGLWVSSFAQRASAGVDALLTLQLGLLAARREESESISRVLDLCLAGNFPVGRWSDRSLLILVA